MLSKIKKIRWPASHCPARVSAGRLVPHELLGDRLLKSGKPAEALA